MTGPNTNDQGQADGASSSSTGGSDSATSQNAGASSASARETTTQTTTKKVDRSSVSDGVKRATGEEGHDSPSEGVTRTDGGAQARDDAARRNR